MTTLYELTIANGAFTFTPQAALTALPMPWIGQNVATVGTDDFSSNDCGPACVAMWLGYLRKNFTVDQVSAATGQAAGYTYTLPAHLIKAAGVFDLMLRRYLNITLNTIRDQIDNFNPLIVLVHYGSLPKRYSPTFKAGHWLIVTGYDGNNVIYNDPLWQSEAGGKSIVISWIELDQAMADCALDGNTARQGLVKA